MLEHVEVPRTGITTAPTNLLKDVFTAARLFVSVVLIAARFVLRLATLVLMVDWTLLLRDATLALVVVRPPLIVEAVENSVVMFEPWLLTVACTVAILDWIVVIVVAWEISVAFSTATFENSVEMLVAAIAEDVCSDAIELF